MTKSSKLKRTLPYISVLLNTPNPNLQNRLIKSFPNFVLDDIVEVLYNVMLNNVKLRSPKQKQAMTKHRKQLTLLFNNSKRKRKRRNIIRKQRGGFLPAVLPVIASVLASAFL